MLSSISSAGFYTKAALTAYADHLRFGESKKNITSSITRIAGGLSPTSNVLAMHNLFSVKQAHSIIKGAYMKVFGWFSEFFWWMSSLSGVVFMWNIVNYLVNVVINGIQLRNLVGCSSFLLFALWGSCSHMFVHQRFTPDIHRHTNERLDEIDSRVSQQQPVPVVRHTRNSLMDVLDA